MLRIFFFREGLGIPYRYLDSVHAALVNGLKAAGVAPDLIIGSQARPWTFATKGFAQKGGQLFLKGITVSTSDPDIAEALLRLDPSRISHSSMNGDEIALGNSWRKLLPDPLKEGQDQLAICFASPFLLSFGTSTAHGKKKYSDSLAGLDLSAAFSHGLSRRLGRAVNIEVLVDPLSVAVNGKPRIITLRRTPAGNLLVPAFSTMLTLKGTTEDLRAAYFSGLGEKTRYGFGCAATLN